MAKKYLGPANKAKSQKEARALEAANRAAVIRAAGRVPGLSGAKIPTAEGRGN